jgi:hypothetical protein
MPLRTIRAFFVAITIGMGSWLAVAPPAVACSCMQFESMADYAGEPDSAIFTGVVEPRDARGFPVTVTRWFQGGGVLEPRIWFDPAGFGGDGASCGIDPLPVGGEWIFVAYRAEGQRDLGLSLCSPHAQAGDPVGEAMLADALRTFGGPVLPAPDPPPGPADPTTAAGSPGDVLVPVAVALVALAGIVLGAALVFSRRREG